VESLAVRVRHDGRRQVDVGGFAEGDDAQLRPDGDVGDEAIEGALDGRPTTVLAHGAAPVEEQDVTAGSGNDVVKNRIPGNFLRRRNEVGRGRCGRRRRRRRRFRRRRLDLASSTVWRRRLSNVRHRVVSRRCDVFL